MQPGKTSIIVEAQYLSRRLRRRSDRHKREGECAIPGEICTCATVLPASRGDGMHVQKSAEGTVGMDRVMNPEILPKA